MDAAKFRIGGSDFVGVFATSSDRFVFAGRGLTSGSKKLLSDTLKVKLHEVSISGSDLVGLFSRTNSNGIILSNLVLEHELHAIKALNLDMKMGVLESELNAVGSNILANDKIAIINPDYGHAAALQIQDILDVEVIKAETGSFKTVGANNILTGRGLAINNRCTEDEKALLDEATGFKSMRTTANTGALSIGLATVANSNAVVAGDSTTGFELNRIIEALEGQAKNYNSPKTIPSK
ncbi:MAG: translation initiation factor IF-6 [Candidatus Micrarchaeota archaeon]|nr:translation initiation factor IF-6 [Candidatus Micrarchaeota archaeon]